MICVSYGNNDYSEFENLLSKYELLELRLDKCSFSIQQICQAMKLNNGIILSYACNELSNERIEFLRMLIDCGAVYIDGGFNPENEKWRSLIEYCKTWGCRIIISYHNFSESPRINVLTDIMTKSNDFKPEIMKIACKANTSDDCSRILSLYHLSEQIFTGETKLIAVSMGEIGKISRLVPIFLASPFTYCTFEKGAETAEGQFDIQTMESIIKLIENGL